MAFENEFRFGESLMRVESEGIVFLQPVGHLSVEMAERAVAELLKTIGQTNGKLRLLVDANASGKPTPESRAVFQDQILHNPRVGKAAVFGVHPVARIISSFLIGATRKKDIKFFGDEKEARVWLEA